MGESMKNVVRTGLFVFLCGVATVRAEVTDAAAGGFRTVNEVTISSGREHAWKAAIEGIGGWWSAEHTVSGDASRLSITPVRQGCFCEDFGSDTGVVHLTVTMVNPAVIIRFTGGLGPLGLMGVNGNMTWEFEDAVGGTKVRITYAVGGYRKEGLDSIAGSVDGVIAEALARLKSYAQGRDAGDADAG